MPHRSSIEWCDYTSNPIKARHTTTGRVGWHCVRHAAGCAHCYAAVLNRRFGTGDDYTTKAAKNVELFLDVKELDRITRFRPRGPFVAGDRPIVFLQDMGDLFENRVLRAWLDAIFEVIERPHLRDVFFVILTKRVQSMRGYLYARWRGAPAYNVIVSCSVATQADVEENLPALASCPARLRMVSAEPLIERIRIPREWLNRIYWVIVGHESGPRRRAGDVGDIRALEYQCAAAGVPFFNKQMQIDGRVSHMPRQWPADLRVREFPALTPAAR